MTLSSRLVLASVVPSLLAVSLLAIPATPAGASPHVGTTAFTTYSRTGSRIPAPPRIYYTTVERQIAHWLHLSVAQVKRKLRTETDLFYVASDQHVRDVPNQVVAHELAALQVASNQLVARHVWTRLQARQNMQTWRRAGAKLITDTVSGWFRRY
jgi:hypothetical protein